MHCSNPLGISTKLYFSSQLSYLQDGFMKKSNEIHYGYIIVFCCCLIMGINVGLTMSCAGIFYRPVSEDLGVSVGTFGLYMSVNYLASMMALSVAGKLLDKFSARVLLTLSSAVLGCCLIAMSFFTAVWQFYLAGGMIGITLAFLLYLSFPTLINRWFRTKVGFFIGVCSAASGIGGVLFNPVGAYLITLYGWRTTYGIFGFVILLLITPILGLLLRDYPEDKGISPYGEEVRKSTAHAHFGIEYSKAIKMPIFYGLVIFAFLMVSVSTLNLFIPNYISVLGYSLEQASLVASAVMFGVTIGKVALGMINDRNHTIGIATSVVFGITGLILLLMGRTGILIVTCGGFLFGWAYAGVTVQTPLLVRAVFGSKDYAQIYSNISIALAAGGALMAGVWGILADLTTFAFVLSLGIVFLTISGCIGLYALRATCAKQNEWKNSTNM